MDKNKKTLKEYSIVILVFVAITLVRSIVSLCVKGLPQVEAIPEGMTKELVNIAAIISCVIGFIILIPQIYVGLKGLQIANGATVNGKAHLIWALILAVLAAISTISAISGLISAINFDTIYNVIDPAIDVLLFVCYYICARKIVA